MRIAKAVNDLFLSDFTYGFRKCYVNTFVYSLSTDSITIYITHMPFLFV